jgi:hypothetical protein
VDDPPRAKDFLGILPMSDADLSMKAVEKLAIDDVRGDRGPRARARRHRRRSFTHSGRRSLSAPFLNLGCFFVRFLWVKLDSIRQRSFSTAFRWSSLPMNAASPNA